jgi:hypothetical protein
VFRCAESTPGEPGRDHRPTVECCKDKDGGLAGLDKVASVSRVGSGYDGRLPPVWAWASGSRGRRPCTPPRSPQLRSLPEAGPVAGFSLFGHQNSFPVRVFLASCAPWCEKSAHLKGERSRLARRIGRSWSLLMRTWPGQTPGVGIWFILGGR